MSKLYFIYNADSGLANGLLDTGRRIFRPNAYPCALCKVTYGPFGMKSDWKDFIGKLPYETIFLHKNERPSSLQDKSLDLPCLLLQNKTDYKTLIAGEEFRSINNLETLKQRVNQSLQVT